MNTVCSKKKIQKKQHIKTKNTKKHINLKIPKKKHKKENIQKQKFIGLQPHYCMFSLHCALSVVVTHMIFWSSFIRAYAVRCSLLLMLCIFFHVRAFMSFQLVHDLDRSVILMRMNLRSIMNFLIVCI